MGDDKIGSIKIACDAHLLFKLWEGDNKSEAIKLLHQWIANKGPQGLAMALDFIEMTHTTRVGTFTVTPDDLGIARQEINSNESRLAAKKLPPFNVRSCMRILKTLSKDSI